VVTKAFLMGKQQLLVLENLEAMRTKERLESAKLFFVEFDGDFAFMDQSVTDAQSERVRVRGSVSGEGR